MEENIDKKIIITAKSSELHNHFKSDLKSNQNQFPENRFKYNQNHFPQNRFSIKINFKSIFDFKSLQ